MAYSEILTKNPKFGQILTLKNQNFYLKNQDFDEKLTRKKNCPSNKKPQTLLTLQHCVCDYQVYDEHSE